MSGAIAGPLRRSESLLAIFFSIQQIALVLKSSRKSPGFLFRSIFRNFADRADGPFVGGPGSWKRGALGCMNKRNCVLTALMKYAVHQFYCLLTFSVSASMCCSELLAGVSSHGNS